MDVCVRVVHGLLTIVKNWHLQKFTFSLPIPVNLIVLLWLFFVARRFSSITIAKCRIKCKHLKISAGTKEKKTL